MGENTRRIEREIVAERTDLGRNLKELEDKAKALTDWRVHYRNHSAAFVGAAFGTGLVLGAVLKASRSRFSTNGDYYAVEAPPHRDRMRPLGRETERIAGQVKNTWDHIADALLGLAAAKAVQFVGEKVPGFADHYRGGLGHRVS